MDMEGKSDISNAIHRANNAAVDVLAAGKPKSVRAQYCSRVKKEFQTHHDQSLLDACSGDLDNLTFDIVVKFALNGDLICRQAIEEVAVNLGVGIADLVNIFNPDLIVIGGAFIQAKDIMHSIIEKTIFSNALQPSTDNLQIEVL